MKSHLRTVERGCLMLGGWDLYTTTIRGWFWSIITFCEKSMFYHFVAHVFLHGVEEKKSHRDWPAKNMTQHIIFQMFLTEMGGPRCGVPWVPWYMAGLWVTLPHLTSQTMGIQPRGDWPATIGSPAKGAGFLDPSQFAQKKPADWHFFFRF